MKVKLTIAGGLLLFGGSIMSSMPAARAARDAPAAAAGLILPDALPDAPPNARSIAGA